MTQKTGIRCLATGSVIAIIGIILMSYPDTTNMSLLESLAKTSQGAGCVIYLVGAALIAFVAIRAKSVPED